MPSSILGIGAIDEFLSSHSTGGNSKQKKEGKEGG